MGSGLSVHSVQRSMSSRSSQEEGPYPGSPECYQLGSRVEGALERSVQVPAVALRQHVEVVAGCQDYHPPLIREEVEEKHVSLPEGAAVFGIKVELSKGERGSWTGVKSPPGSLSNLLQGFFARKEGKGIRRQGSSGCW